MTNAAKTTSPSQTGMSHKVARVVTEVFNPPWVAIAVLGAVAFETAGTIRDFLQWWAIASFFATMLPMGFLVQALRRGRVSDWYLTRAEERLVPFAVALVSVGAAVFVMVTFAAPRALLAVTLAGMVGIIVAIALTLLWKLSLHAGSIAGALVVLVLTFGLWALAFAPAVPAVGWARVRIAHHTPSQVIVGGVIGAAVAGVVFTAVMALA